MNQVTNALPVRFQVITGIITTTIIVYFVYHLMTTFCSLDQKPTFEPLVSATKELSGKAPAQVIVGLSINDFTEFNTVENKFVFSGIIWFEFDPRCVSLDSIGKFSFDHAELEYKSEPYLYEVNSKLLARYTIRVRFRSDLSYKYFPFEDHKLYLVLINNAVSIHQLVYSANHNYFRLSKEATVLSEWSYHDRSVYAGYASIVIGSKAHERKVHYPCAVFEVDYLRTSIRYIIIIILPLLLIFFIELFSLCVDQEEQRGALIQLSATNIAALLAYRFVLESIAPRVGYLMLSDYFFFLFLGISFLMFFINGAGSYISLFQKKLISIGLQTFVVLVLLSISHFLVKC